MSQSLQSEIEDLKIQIEELQQIFNFGMLHRVINFEEAKDALIQIKTLHADLKFLLAKKSE